MSDAASTPATAPRYLVDTNVLLREAQPSHALHAAARGALRSLIASGAVLFLMPQNVYEFWAVATRPVGVNGLGWTPAQADTEFGRLERVFTILPETPDVYKEWRRVVAVHGVSGLETHDARLIAAMRVHGLAHILTFDADDFRRYEAAPPKGEGVAVVNPSKMPPMKPQSVSTPRAAT